MRTYNTLRLYRGTKLCGPVPGLPPPVEGGCLGDAGFDGGAEGGAGAGAGFGAGAGAGAGAGFFLKYVQSAPLGKRRAH